MMFKHLVVLGFAAFAAAFASPAVAQQPPGTSVGTLTCRLAPSIGLIFGSRQRMSCRFNPSGGVPENYSGVMGTVGLDIGITAGGGMAWRPQMVLVTVRSPTGDAIQLSTVRLQWTSGG